MGMCITEVKISKKNYNYYNHKNYNTFHNLPDNHKELAPKSGLIILIQKSLCNTPLTITHIHPGRATTIKINLDDSSMKCYCLYALSQNDTASLPFHEDLFYTQPPDPMQNI